MAFIQQVVDGDRRIRWVEIRTADGKKFSWRRMNLDRIIEAESDDEYGTRTEAEDAAAADPGNRGLDVAVGPDPEQHEGRVAGPAERKME